MTRYFYRCPIAAAWQLKHHGIKFEGQHIEYLQLPVYSSEWLSLIDLTKISSPIIGWEKIVVSEDSLPLLQPMVGDAVMLENNDTMRIDEFQDIREVGDKRRIWQRSEYRGNGTFASTSAITRIIMRNNIAFISPEVEG